MSKRQQRSLIIYLIITTVVCVLLIALIRILGNNPNLTRIVSYGWCLSTSIVMIVALTSKKEMTKENAVTLLEACKSIADRLAAKEVISDLKNKKEREALQGLNKVWTANLLEDPDVQRRAELSQQDIINLKYFLFQREAREMRLQYEIDNTRTTFAARYLLRQIDKHGAEYKLTETDNITIRKIGKLMENNWIEENQDLDNGTLLLPAQIERLNSLLLQVQDKENSN